MRLKCQTEVCWGLLLFKTCEFLWIRRRRLRYPLMFRRSPRGKSHIDIEDLYGVVLEDEDEDSGDEDLDHPTS